MYNPIRNVMLRQFKIVKSFNQHYIKNTEAIKTKRSCLAASFILMYLFYLMLAPKFYMCFSVCLVFGIVPKNHFGNDAVITG